MFAQRRASRISFVPLIQVLSLVLVFALPAFWSARVYTSSPVHYQRVVVRPGDTLWTLTARRSAANRDMAESVYEAAQANDIKPGAPLRPGQVLLFPDR